MPKKWSRNLSENGSLHFIGYEKENIWHVLCDYITVYWDSQIKNIFVLVIFSKLNQVNLHVEG